MLMIFPKSKSKAVFGMIVLWTKKDKQSNECVAPHHPQHLRLCLLVLVVLTCSSGEFVLIWMTSHKLTWWDGVALACSYREFVLRVRFWIHCTGGSFADFRWNKRLHKEHMNSRITPSDSDFLLSSIDVSVSGLDLEWIIELDWICLNSVAIGCSVMLISTDYQPLSKIKATAQFY